MGKGPRPKSPEKDAPAPPARASRWGRWLSVLLLVAAAAALARLETIQVVSLKNGQFQLGRYRVIEDPWDHPRLKLLRAREKLDAVAAPGKTQFEKVVLLRHWARTQWESGPKFYYPPGTRWRSST